MAIFYKTADFHLLAFLFYFYTPSLLICTVNQVGAEPNLDYTISQLCDDRRSISPFSKRIDGAVLTSSQEENLNCVLTFHTETVLQRFMLRFEYLALDCNDHLFIFDGDLAVGSYKTDLSCRSTRTNVGLIFTQSNFVTLKYVTDNWSKPGDGFVVVITAYKDSPTIDCGVFRCMNTFCISNDLRCDRINHCSDNSDETSHAHCPTELDDELVLGFQIRIFFGIAIVTIIVFLSCVITLAICLCRREQQLLRQQKPHQRIGLKPTTPIMAHPASYTCTTGSLISPGNQRFATLPFDKLSREKAPPPPSYPGNMFTPAAGSNNTANNVITGSTNYVAGNNGKAVQQVVYYGTK